MSTPPPELVRAWLDAAPDLGITVIAPYSVGQQEFVALVQGFGSEKGTVVDWMASGNETAQLKEQGYYLSAINPGAYGAYDRDLFRDTLDDWGWHGDPERRPNWSTDHPWAG